MQFKRLAQKIAFSLSDRHPIVYGRGRADKHFLGGKLKSFFLCVSNLLNVYSSLFFHLSTLKKNLLFKYPQQGFALFCVLFLETLTYVKRLMGVPVNQAGTVFYALM